MYKPIIDPFDGSDSFENSFQSIFLAIPTHESWEEAKYGAVEYVCDVEMAYNLLSVLYPPTTKKEPPTIFDMAKHVANIALSYCDSFRGIRKEAVFAVAYELINEQKEFWAQSEKKSIILEPERFSKLVELLQQPQIDCKKLDELSHGLPFKEWCAYKKGFTKTTFYCEQHFSELCELAYSIARSQKGELQKFQNFWLKNTKSALAENLLNVLDPSTSTGHGIFAANQNNGKLVNCMWYMNKNQQEQTSEPQKSDFISMSDAARLLQVMPSTISRWEKQGIIPAAQRVKGHVFFRRQDLLKALKKDKV